jgi:hypothetical protein
MFEFVVLTPQQIGLCHNTISSNTFYMLTGHALKSGVPLSVVRMGDGEKQLLDLCGNGAGQELVPPPPGHGEEWLVRMGCVEISKAELRKRLTSAAVDATYFAPSVSGITLEAFHMYNRFPARDRYVDNFFCNAWDEEMKIDLFKAAGHVLFIHRNAAPADAMQMRAKSIGVKVTYLKLERWQDAESVITQARMDDAKLVLFSAGPASKYIGPRIATGGFHPKVTLDIGNAADFWLLNSLK